MPGRVFKAACATAITLAACAVLASTVQGRALHAMKIDATGLSSNAFHLEGQWYEGDAIETVELDAGSHYLAPGAGLVMRCVLVVTEAGTWDYASDCDGFLAGRGTDTLRLLGYTVTMDASPLSTPIFLANLNVAQLGASARPVTLLPTFAEMLPSPGVGVISGCSFRIELDGTIGYADEVQGCLTGRGTRTVTFHGVAVNVDARELTTRSFSILLAYSLMHLPSDVVQHFRLLPTLSGYQYGGWTVSGILWPSLGLRIGLDGKIDYPASADSWVAGRGTDTLVVHGHTVQIDARAVPPNSFHIPDAEALNLGGAIHTLRLAPVSYLYFTGDPAVDFRFSIRESDGAIDAGGAACGRGQGTTLIVGCPAPPPPPQPPQPPAPAENVKPPQIRFLDRTSTGTSYRCEPTGWEGLGDFPRFQYEWYRLGTITGSLGGVVRETPDVRVATIPGYTVPVADYGKKYSCVITVVAPSGRRLTAASPPTVLTGRNDLGSLVTSFFGDFHVRGIDVFQVVQPNPGAQMFGFPDGAFPSMCSGGTPTAYPSSSCFAPVADPQRASYSGVPLDQRKPTTAVVYVGMNGVKPSDPRQPIEVTLSASVGGRRLSGTTTKKRDKLPVTFAARWVNLSERATGDFGVPFAVPADWLRASVMSGKPLDLEATVALPVGAGSDLLRECPPVVAGGTGCAANDRYALDGVPVFDDLPDLTVRSLPLRATTNQVLAAPQEVLNRATRLFPGGERLTILPYQAAVDIPFVDTLQLTDAQCKVHRDLRSCQMAHVDLALDRWWLSDAQNRRGYNLLMAVHDYTVRLPGDSYSEPGWWRRPTTLATVGQAPTITVNDGSAGRPVSAAAHEFGHAVGLPHAGEDTACYVQDPTQVGEVWSTDGRGRAQGLAFERGSLLGRLTYRVRLDTESARLHDLMSYCAGRDGEQRLSADTDAWISPRNWNRAFAILRSVARARRVRFTAASAGRAGSALVLGDLGASGARIERVIAADPENLAPAPDPQSRLRARALTVAGTVLGEAGVAVRRLEDAPDAATFVAAVPAGADVVELLSDGEAIDRVTRSRPPTVRVIAPRRGTRARNALPMRWAARDPDGDPLEVTIEYAADGKTWRTVYQGPSRGRARIPGRHLERGLRARVRVSVDDGFNRARAISAPFSAAGRPPAPRIVLPAADESPQAGRALLIGAAVDDRGRRLRGKALTWFAGSRRLGSGERLTATLPAGHVTLRLRARDGARRVAFARRRLKVTPPALQLRVLRVPDRVSPRASTVAIRVATSVPAVVRARGRRWAAGRRARTLMIPLPLRPRTGMLEIELTITARGVRQPPLHPTLVVLRG